MNDLLRDLLGVAPGLIAGLKDPAAGAAVLEGYQRARQQDEQRQRLKRQEALTLQDRDIALQDRERVIERQRSADAIASEDRRRRQAVESLAIPGHLAEFASTAETPQDAQRLIESAMPNLMDAFGQETMAYGMPAVEMATRMITGRQKKQIEAFVEAALKVDHVANNPDADPELVNLPDHIRRIIGQPSARLSQLQSFAQLPVGKPQGKTRVPAMAGSFEDYVEKKYGPNATADQILEARKVYQQVDDRPRITVNTGQGAYPPAQQRRIDAIVKGFDSQPIVKKAQTMAEAVSFAQSMDPNTKNPADDQALIYAFAKAMDPESVVREGEYATVQKYAQSWAQSFGFDVARVFSNTQFLTAQARQNMKATIAAKFKATQGQYENVRKEYGRKIERITGKTGGVDELTDFGAAFPQSAAPGPSQPASARGGAAPQAPAAPAARNNSQSGMPAARKGERRKFGDELREWNGSLWVLVSPSK